MVAVVSVAPKTLGAKGAGATGVFASGGFGWDVAGSVGAIVLVVVAVITLALSVARNNHARRKESADEKRDAFERGQDSMRDVLEDTRADENYWRSYAMSLLAVRSGAQLPPPVPPSERHTHRRDEPTPLPPPSDEDD